MMPTVESASMPVSVDYHHQVHMDDSYPSIGAYPAEVHDTSLYYHNHPHQQQQHHQQLISDPSSMMDSSYNLPCDYNNSAGYCPPDLHQAANYPYQHYATAAAPSVAGATPCDAQSSSGYYSSPVVDHHQQHHYASHQMTDNSSSVSSLMATPYDCYANSHDHLELKYQAAFVDALESNHNNTSMETSSVEGSVVAASSNNTSTTTDMETDPLQIHSSLVQPMPTPEFQYEYETNYGNNEWTMTTSGHYGHSYPTATSEAYPTDNSLTGCPSESDMPILPNYCFAACVFTTPPSSSEPHGSTKVEIGTYSPTTRHFESSYDTNHYQTLNEEPLHPAL
jgi:hypothetical protein